MRRVAVGLAVFAVCSIAGAGRNDLEGGVFIAHHPPGMLYSQATDWCQKYADELAISDCQAQNNRIDLDGNAGESSIWYVLAAWTEPKEWCGVQFGLGQYDPDIYGFVEWEACSPRAPMEIPTENWPGPNEGTAVVVTGLHWCGNFVPVYYFAGYAYGAGIIPLSVDPTHRFGGTCNCCSTQPRRRRMWSAMAFGAMGLFRDGRYVCPGELDLDQPRPAGAPAEQDVAIEGVVYVQNGSVPSKGTETIRLEELWRVNGRDGAETRFERIRQARLGPDGNLYLLAPSVGILVYSMDGEYLKTLSHAGQVRRDKSPVLNFMFMPDGSVCLVQKGSRRIIRLRSSGAAEEGPALFALLDRCGSYVQLFDGDCRGDQIVLAGMTHEPLDPPDSRRPRRITLLSSFTLDGDEEVRYLESGQESRSSGFRFHEAKEYFPAPGHWALGSDGRVYVAPIRDRYEIHTYTAEGRLERVVQRQFEPPRRSLERMALFEAARDEHLKRREGGAYELCMTDPAVTRIRVKDDGTMWVLHAGSAYWQPEGIMQTYDVFDSQGQLIKQVAIACDGDGENDALFFLGDDRVLRVTGVREPALIIPRGVGRGPTFGREAAPAEVVCYRIVS